MDRLTPTFLLIVLLGMVAGGGVLLLIVAIRGVEVRPRTSPANRRTLIERLGRQSLLGAGTAVLVLVLTRWPVAAVGAGGLVAAWPMLFGGGKAEKEAISRLEGLASWTESLRDTIAGAVGLEQAIPATVYAAAPSIQPQLRLLADRLRIRVPMPEALHRFADDLDDPSADLVVASLILNSRLRGPGLRHVLSSLADSARAELDMRQRVFAGRASTRRSVQIVVGVSVAFMVGLSVLNRDYVEPYGDPVGQVVLAIVVAMFALGFMWMRRLSDIEVPGRFLVTTAAGETEARGRS
ncbi:type II secretion system F family protein [Phytoactinopolyspora halotolerans]|uniref:Type II secretion system protein n=1 Tax=Phytoactinopolyspora halotolerans TaxID=1981512 RepID=A0A6L9SE22_9ACTN|nr:type II secretion system F family protein [Phytoactinopolyspora halotolerans]NEE02778.1 type II secretion system protein [Phytoactinopolyspora halotolerans]